MKSSPRASFMRFAILKPFPLFFSAFHNYPAPTSPDRVPYVFHAPFAPFRNIFAVLLCLTHATKNTQELNVMFSRMRVKSTSWTWRSTAGGSRLIFAKLVSKFNSEHGFKFRPLTRLRIKLSIRHEAGSYHTRRVTKNRKIHSISSKCRWSKIQSKKFSSEK